MCSDGLLDEVDDEVDDEGGASKGGNGRKLQLLLDRDETRVKISPISRCCTAVSYYFNVFLSVRAVVGEDGIWENMPFQCRFDLTSWV